MDREALTGDTYLLKRGNVWCLRIRVPTKLVRDGESTHVTRSLKTKDKREARRLANLRLAEIEAQFRASEHSLRPSLSVARRLDELSDGEIERTVADWFHREANLTRDQFYSGIDAEKPQATICPQGPPKP